MTAATGNISGAGYTGNKIPKGYRQGQLQQFDPQQMALYQNLFGLVGPESFTSRLAGGDQDIFNQIEAPAMKQFSALQGGIASRFAGPGGGGSQQALGSRHSSGFQNTMNQYAQDFAGQLQSQRMGLQQQAIRDLMGMSNELLGQRPYEQFLTKKQQDQGIDWLGLGGAALGGVGGFFAGGPAGAVAGAGIGYNALGRGGQGTSNEDIMKFTQNYMK